MNKPITITAKTNVRFKWLAIRYTVYTWVISTIPNKTVKNKLANRINNKLDKKLTKTNKYIKLV